MKHWPVILVAVLCVAVGALWIWNPNSQRLPGGYVLELFESGKYYLRHRGGTIDGGGTFDGTVEEIGWTEDQVLARINRLYDGDPDGWYALSIRTGNVRGPLSPDDIAADASLRVIRPHLPGE